MKKTTIIIEGQPFTFDDESGDITYETIDPINEEDARSLLQTTKTLFEHCNIRFCLAYGTLLGAVRDHGLIKGDEDVDVFIESEDLLWKNIPFLHQNGLKLCRFIKHALYSFHTENNSYIDVYIKGKLPFSIWRIWCDRVEFCAVPKWYISKYDTIEFLGIECLCPHKPERLLRYWYGKTWRTPIRGHNFGYDSPSRNLWRKKIKPKISSYCWTIGYVAKRSFTNPILTLKKIKYKL